MTFIIPQQKIFINGKDAASKILSSVDVESGNKVLIGRQNNKYMKGFLDEVCQFLLTMRICYRLNIFSEYKLLHNHMSSVYAITRFFVHLHKFETFLTSFLMTFSKSRGSY